mmetsp:Transcript_31553/g.78837  ORF Transcript_31553/g.78837 Transcript_31553/m.78837 type:complete len:186 (+) Transcript_31553:4017-4574(+)
MLHKSLSLSPVFSSHPPVSHTTPGSKRVHERAGSRGAFAFKKKCSFEKLLQKGAEAAEHASPSALFSIFENFRTGSRAFEAFALCTFGISARAPRTARRLPPHGMKPMFRQNNREHVLAPARLAACTRTIRAAPPRRLRTTGGTATQLWLLDSASWLVGARRPGPDDPHFGSKSLVIIEYDLKFI